ncbi:thioesterase family protein [Paludisphaera mucosa]|uniref:Thioesterase family protein n=1 Tax=Paludisphaera mucosa TaxID=3030827 RepID=A0ABT6F4R2_9BACT|nr:thioesterase family protein [Paludisphaera mucosa]MDG3002404.1 thioesterase family protein [Paludisphaera mucosa]
MRAGLKVGATGERRFVVETAHAIDFAEGGMPAILCTPWLVWFLEHAAREAVVPFLGEGESTVGSHIEVDHLAATPVGQAVACLARVVHVEGSRVSFQLEARDESEVIARGFHRLHVIDAGRLARRVDSKRRRS